MITNNHLKYPKNHWLVYINITIFFGLIFLIHNPILPINAEDEDEDNDEGSDLSSALGFASIGLFVISTIYIIFYKAFKISRKFSDEGNFAGLKKAIGTFFLKVRKPLLWIHYIAGVIAIGILIAHGILLRNGSTSAVIIGWVTCAIYLAYVLTGIILSLRIKPFFSAKISRTILSFLHKNLILFSLIIIVHIIHVVISED